MNNRIRFSLIIPLIRQICSRFSCGPCLPPFAFQTFEWIRQGLVQRDSGLFHSNVNVRDSEIAVWNILFWGRKELGPVQKRSYKQLIQALSFHLNVTYLCTINFEHFLGMKLPAISFLKGLRWCRSRKKSNKKKKVVLFCRKGLIIGCCTHKAL